MQPGGIRMSKCFAIASGKGGVGKSTVTAALGAALSQAGDHVVIVDADIGLRSQDALLSLENRVVYDLIDLSRGDCTPEQALLASDTFPSLFLLPAAQFARAKKLDPKRFAGIISSLKDSFDWVLIDCPAGIERGLRNVLKACSDDTILVATPDDISIRAAERAAQVLDEKKHSRPLLVVNRLSSDLVRSGEMYTAETVSRVLDLELLGEIPEDPAVYRAQLRHKLFVTYDCEARNAVFRIASRLRGQSVLFPCYGKKHGSLIRRLLSKEMKEVSPIDDH